MGARPTSGRCRAVPEAGLLAHLLKGEVQLLVSATYPLPTGSTLFIWASVGVCLVGRELV